MEIPPVVVERAKALGATTWLDQLPELVAELEDQWQIAAGPVCRDATEAFVAHVRTEFDEPAVLKLVVPGPGDAARHEATVLRAAGGEGCVRLLRYDAERGALLVEALGAALFDLGWPLAKRMELLADLAASVWRPAPALDLPTGRSAASRLSAFIADSWERLGRPCSAAAYEYALLCAERRAAAHDDERAVLVHGDVHQWNALRTLDGGAFKLIDPDGLRAEPAFDLGVLMREDPEELLHGDPRDRAQSLAARHSVDSTAIWEWGALQRVATGMRCVEVGLEPVGHQMLEVADRVALAL